MENLKQSHPHEGRTMTKVTYGWTVQSKVITMREEQRPKSPTGGRSKVKSFPTRKDYEQSRLWVDNQMQVILKWEI